MITEAYPDIKTYYGALSGPAFTLSFAVFGIFGGVLSDRYNRRFLMGSCAVVWSVTTLLSGLINNFWLLFVFRFFLGFFESFFNPCAYSIISDYFHPATRTTANSVFNLGIYLGGAMSSLSLLIVGAIGWRWTYNLIGFIGIGAGVLGLLTILEPKRGKFNPPKKGTDAGAPKDERSVLVKFGEAMKEVM